MIQFAVEGTEEAPTAVLVEYLALNPEMGEKIAEAFPDEPKVYLRYAGRIETEAVKYITDDEARRRYVADRVNELLRDLGHKVLTDASLAADVVRPEEVEDTDDDA